jgi:hypothetical protein
VESSPVIDDNGTPAVSSDDTIYVGSESDKLLAFDTAGNKLWEFPTAGKVKTRPTISADGNTIYVSSDKNRVYALNKIDRLNDEAFPTENEWEFTPDGKTRAPALGASGIVYLGSEGDSGGLLYAMKGDFAEPKNERGTLITYSEEMGTDFDPIEIDDWLIKNDYAVRLEVMRSLNPDPDGQQHEYTLRTWIRRCPADDCAAANITGTFFQDTRVQYAWSPEISDDFPAPNSFIEQTIKLSPEEHAKLDRFLFGFTGATAATFTQSVLIKQFQLSFIRPNDPIVTEDANWPPLEP